MLVMDWIMKRAADTGTSGLEWVNGEWLTDLDFAKDINLLGSTWEGMVELTDRVQKKAATVGFKINADKPKITVIGVHGEVQKCKQEGRQ
jgi:hypothetical protein